MESSTSSIPPACESASPRPTIESHATSKGGIKENVSHLRLLPTRGATRPESRSLMSFPLMSALPLTLLETASPGQSTLSLIAILSLGFFLGMRHATDADHVVAVSTIVTRERRLSSAALIGALWGAGHTLTILAVGAGIILFTLVIPARLGLTMEFSVGLMLILLGAFNLRGFGKQISGISKSQDHTHEDHTHDGPGQTSSAHTHTSISYLDRSWGRWSVYQWCRPLIVGLVHGLAGSAAVALLVLTTLHNTHWAIAYLLVFGIGTIGGMMVITLALASALRYSSARSAWLNRYLGTVAGFISLAFGLFIVYQMGFVHGLFTNHPTWTPQ